MGGIRLWGNMKDVSFTRFLKGQAVTLCIEGKLELASPLPPQSYATFVPYEHLHIVKPLIEQWIGYSKANLIEKPVLLM